MPSDRTSRSSNPERGSASPRGRAGQTREVIIPINSDLDIIVARQRGRELAAEVGFSGTDLTIIATAISELARNIVLYAKSGEIVMKSVRQNDKRGMAIIADDEGPGIPDIASALQDGFSTSRSLGLGLPGVRRLMDDFEISSEPGNGTTVTVKKWAL